MERVPVPTQHTRSDFPEQHLLFPVSQEAGDPVTDGWGYSALGEFRGEDFRDDGVER